MCIDGKRIPECGRKSDDAIVLLNIASQSKQQAPKVSSSLAADERMNLVNNDKLK